MASETSSKPARAPLTLYANLLEPSSTSSSTHGTISRAPIVFKQSARDDLRVEDDSSFKQQLSAASLRFQPTKRPQLSSQKPKIKPTSQRAGLPPPAHTKTSDMSAPEDIYSAPRNQPKNTLADWTAEPELGEGGFYNVEKRQRGGRKKRKKNLEDPQTLHNWDDIYDPSRPNTFDDYKHSDEKMFELREWKDKLYAHRMASSSQSDVDSGGEIPKQFGHRELKMKALSFAPPGTYVGQRVSECRSETYTSNAEDSDLRYGLLSPSPVEEPSQYSDTAQRSTSHRRPTPEIPTPPVQYIVNDSHASSLPSSETTATAPSHISRSPILYKPSEDILDPKSEPEHETMFFHTENGIDSASRDSPRSLRPGQKGFAERLMSKYGWTKGSGLGASGSGIVNPLRVQLEKQKKKPDSEGGGVVGHGGKGKILGGRKGGSSAMAETGRFGIMSEVVILLGMVDGMDLDLELERSGDGGLMQEIGDECGAKYGRVERVYIDRSSPQKPPVFVKFTSQLSALRAVNALEGRVFNGNKITARFFDSEAFERGNYSYSNVEGNGQLRPTSRSGSL